jgi:hypothetical protein
MIDSSGRRKVEVVAERFIKERGCDERRKKRMKAQKERERRNGRRRTWGNE